MTNQAMQCCYTNVSNGSAGRTGGWQAVAVSPAIPTEAYSMCTRLQSINSTIQNAMLDEDGNVLNLLEITGDKSYIYVMRTQYGLLDQMGRANMFSHAYIFPCSGMDASAVIDPNEILTLANSNFKTGEEEANQPQESLERLPAMDLEAALARCGLTTELYRTLLRGVYAQFSDRRTVKPLFLQYDGTEEHLRALLYCIYFGLPWSVRRGLSIASNETENTSEKNIIFSKRASQHELYLDPATGENTILQGNTAQRFARLGFVDYIADNYRTVNAAEYFRGLEEKALELGDASAANTLVLKIAHQILCCGPIGTLSEEDFSTRLSDCFRSRSTGNTRIDDYLALMISAVVDRGMLLSEENEKDLNQWQENVSEQLAEAAGRYTFYRFQMLPAEKAVEHLSSMNPTAFSQYAKRLACSPEGVQVLDSFYSGKLAARKGVSWKLLQGILDEILQLPGSCEKTRDTTEKVAWDMYCDAIDNGAADGYSHVEEAQQQYLSVIQRLYSGQSIETYEAASRDAFWQMMRISALEISQYPKYQAMASEHPHCELVMRLFDMLPLAARDERRFFNEVSRFFLHYVPGIQPAETAILKEKLMDWSERDQGMGKSFLRWFELFLSLPSEELLEPLDRFYTDCTAAQFSDSNMQLTALCNDYKEFVDKTKFISRSRESKRLLAEVLLRKLASVDRSRPVDLDIWLTFGSLEYENCFDVLDRVNPAPAVLMMDPVEVVARSRLLQTKESYLLKAEYYVQEKKPQAKTVKRWAAEARQMQKQRGAAPRSVPARPAPTRPQQSRGQQSMFVSNGDPQRPNDSGFFRKK